MKNSADALLHKNKTALRKIYVKPLEVTLRACNNETFSFNILPSLGENSESLWHPNYKQLYSLPDLA